MRAISKRFAEGHSILRQLAFSALVPATHVMEMEMDHA